MSETYDVIILGMGPGGEVAAGRLLKAGRRVAVVERELIGGECAYWACIPSKTLLRPVEARAEATRAAGLGTPGLTWQDVADYRDYMIRHLDDAEQVKSYEQQGATVIKAAGRITGPGRVEAGGRTLAATHIIVATGSEAQVPPVEGLEQAGYWTNREATTLKEVPRRALLIGGGPVGIELGQMLAGYGAEVTLVEMADRLIEREEPRVGELIGQALTQDGVRVHTGRQVKSARTTDAGIAVALDDGSVVTTDVIVAATGRKPRLHGLGLETAGVDTSGKGLAADERCRLGEGLWAVGDVTGVMPFTHVAQYQARVVADNILGHDRRADYSGIPRVVFSDPEIAAAGLTQEQAAAQGCDVATARVSLPEVLARPWTYERDPRGELGLVADRRRGVLVGAWAVAPLAGEWIHYAALAIRARIPLATLLDTVAQFPTYSEAYLSALENL